MTVTFDLVLPELVRICDASPEMVRIKEAMVIRDLNGCARLVVRPVLSDTITINIQSLETAITSVLGKYFRKPILTTDAISYDERRLANELMKYGEEWHPFYEDPVTLSPRKVTAGKWKKLDRRLSKHVWLEDNAPTAMPPWDLQHGRPAIVTFYSFKGGVGRSTALVSCAWQLAVSGKRVCIIDLDLEAPGMGALLNVDTSRGVLDFLVDFVATGSAALAGCHSPASVLGDDAAKVDVISAGRINLNYLEKLARLDYSGDRTFDEKKSPVQRAMEALLHKATGELHPDYIFIDSRAGLHDLAGLSLHGLAHVDVIVARASEQSYAGLDLTLEALGIRKAVDLDRLLAVIVHTFAHPDELSTEGISERRAFLSHVYTSFVKHIYSRIVEDDPQEQDNTAAHSPIVISQNEHLERFSSIAAAKTREALFGEDFVRLCKRIEELCRAPDVDDTEDEET